MSSPLETIAARLAQRYNERAELGLVTWQAEKDIAARQLALTPADGWPGKNEAQRDAARDKCFAADDELRGHAALRDQAHGRLAIVTGEIEGLEAERRAGEWQVRARLVEALERRAVQPNGRGDRTERGFDDAAEHELDTEVWYEAEAELLC